MDFPAAVALSEAMARNYPALMVAGFRRTSLERPVDSWALDVVDPETGRMVTLDEKDDWERRLGQQFPSLVHRH
ncbi:MAG TPA: hypothetical protein VFY10_11085 [Dehalococcoidia bacterium]|nr:hypothetical protein [Dehalococcoidia bacterium]